MNSSAKDILSFHFSPFVLKKAANSLLPSSKMPALESNIGKLNEITEQLGKAAFTFFDKPLIPYVSQKFQKGFKAGMLPSFSKRELRALTYALSHSEADSSIYDNPDQLRAALDLIDESWKDSYNLGLFDCYLKKWGSGISPSFKLLREFGFQRLTNYRGNRPVLNAIKANLHFFDPFKGDVLLGSELAIKRIPIQEAPKYLSLPNSWFTYPYFSKVILSFYDRNKDYLDNLLPEIEKALLTHTNQVPGTKTSKLVVSRIILQCNEARFAHLQDKVQELAIKSIGDPAKDGGLWSNITDASDAEISNLKKSREVLNSWITRKFITVFFEKCLNDPRRKRFWLKMHKHVTSFKVFGPANIKTQLRQDKRISEFVHHRYQNTESQRQVAAILMNVNDYTLIEFSDPGYAFYAYKRSSPFAPTMDQKYNSVDDFRNGSMPKLVYREGYYLYNYAEEGRLTHNDGDLSWEDVFAEWIKMKVHVDI